MRFTSSQKVIFRKFIISSLAALLVFPLPLFAADVLIYSQETHEEEANSLIIDFDDTGGDITLQFGNTLNEQFFWDNSNTRFTVTDDLKVQGNVAIDGTDIFLDDNNVGSGANVNIIANQGSDSDGTLRYNATDNRWEISNDGGSFNALATAGNLPSVQVRRRTAFTVPASYADVTFDQTDIETNVSVLEHNDTDTDRIDIKQDGIYLVTYDFSIDTPATTNDADVFARMRVNDTTVINGSAGQTSMYASPTIMVTSDLSQSFIANLSDGDFISIQFQFAGITMDTVADGVVTITKLDGINSNPSAVVAQAYESGTTTFNAATAIDWDGTSANARVIDNIYAHDTGSNPSRITVNQNGLYRVSYNVSWDTSVNSRRTATCNFAINGTAVTPAIGSSHAYARNSTDDTETNSASFIYRFTSGQYYEIQCTSTGTAGSITTLADQSWTSIEYLQP